MIGTVELSPGTIVDGWQVVGAMGKGGFGTVHHVEKDGQPCALKLALHREESGDGGRTHARTLREVLILLMLDHPNIVKPRSFGYLPDGRVYLVLEYVDGWTLDQWVERTHPTAQEIARVFMKIADAAAYMHRRGVKHRDLKLKNVLIRREDGEPIIIDFGASTYEHAEELTGAGLPPGTDRFRAPEALGFLSKLGRFGKERYSFQVADEIFSLGVMLYDVLTDPRPTEHKGKTPLNSPVRLIPFGSPHRVNPRVPLAMSNMVMHLLALDPKHRPENMETVRRELEELAEHQGTEYAVPVHLPSEQRAPAPEGNERPGEVAPPELRGWPRVRAVPGMVVDRIRRWPNTMALAGVVAAVMLAIVAVSWLIRGERPHLPLPTPSREVTTPTLPSAGPALPPVNSSPVSAPAPTHASGPLPAAPATAQKEGSPVKTQPPEAPTEARTPRGLKTPPRLALCKALLPAAAIAAGCTGVPVRPESFECPPGAVEAMERLGWDIGGSDRIPLKLDERGPSRGYHWFTPGPVTGVVPAEATGSKHAPPGTLFHGKLYFTEKTAEWPLGEVIAIYDHVEMPGKGKFPVCAVSTLNQIRELKDGTAKAASVAFAKAKRRWAP
ncbi:protein kinase [Stigmatella sp. ncwal1]|uniref:Protein kinase n=1 Tax=Stigmatella ashevillensis TaxID=2995309 RepID=A0ABT5D1D7_9BACT|nr:serine/threonine protein kinase [Stigmatella ashevillena]MDC0707482.1 protein kinase [Stigmatella ashevillena]